MTPINYVVCIYMDGKVSVVFNHNWFPKMNDFSRLGALQALTSVVKLLSKMCWIPAGARLEGPKFEAEGPRAEVGFPIADQEFSSIQGTLFGFCGI